MGEGARFKRALRTMFIRPSRQLKLTLAMLSVGILFTALLMGYLVIRVAAVVSAVQSSNPDIAALIQANLDPTLSVILLGQGLLWLSSLLIGILISHRIYGPIIPIVRHVQQLGRGDYSSRIQLRKDDDLGEIAEALNELASRLEKEKKPN
jgi:signal transduction histidine kinase